MLTTMIEAQIIDVRNLKHTLRATLALLKYDDNGNYEETHTIRVADELLENNNGNDNTHPGLHTN